MPDMTIAKRRVAGYARVSTDSDEQYTSYQAQVDYYTQFIKSNPDWTFVDVYTDEGISGTNTKHRAGFNRMIRDALDGRLTSSLQSPFLGSQGIRLTPLPMSELSRSTM
jgi:DNA invertase Pin-like site-specific DNA recombinase